MEIAPTLIGFMFVALGVVYFFRADLVIKFQIWIQQKVMGVKYAPSERTHKIVRAVGAIWFIIGLLAITGVFNLE